MPDEEVGSRVTDGRPGAGAGAGVGMSGTLAILAAAVLLLVQIDLSNAALYPLFDAVAPVARDVNVGTGVLVNVAVVATSARRPSLLRERVLAIASFACAIVGMALLLAGLRVSSPALLCAGAVVRGVGTAWIGLLCLVARCSLAPRALLAGIPAAYGVALFLAWALTAAPLGVGLGTLALCPLAALLLARRFAGPVVRHIAQEAAQSDVRLLQPSSSVPLASRFYLCIFVCTVAMGVNLRLGPVEGSQEALVPCLAVCGAMFALGAFGSGVRRYDQLFSAGIVLLFAGFLVAPLSDYRALTQGLIAMGGAFLNVLFALVLASVSARNPLASASVFAWGGVVSSLGSIVGANVGALVAARAESDAVFLASAAVAALLLSYVLLGLRGFSLAETIEGIRPPEPARVSQGSRVEEVERTCAELAAARGLTPREAEVLALLARGHNNAVIQEELTLTRNTVKTYVKRIYAKLDVHSQQEVIDLVEGVMDGA